MVLPRPISSARMTLVLDHQLRGGQGRGRDKCRASQEMDFRCSVEGKRGSERGREGGREGERKKERDRERERKNEKQREGQQEGGNEMKIGVKYAHSPKYENMHNPPTFNHPTVPRSSKSTKTSRPRKASQHAYMLPQQTAKCLPADPQHSRISGEEAGFSESL